MGQPDEQEFQFPTGMCRVTYTSPKEHVGLPDYSWVEFGPVVLERIVPDTVEARKEAFDQLKVQGSEMVAELRAATVENIQAFAAQGGYGNIKQTQ
jgi:hypothetical protein